MLEEFLYSIAEEIMPAIEPRHNAAHFAFIAEDGRSMTESELWDICRRTSLSPIFLAISREGPLIASRRLARRFNARVLIPGNRRELMAALSSCRFSISESALGAFLSFISKTPVYLDVTADDCREMLWELSSLPHSENAVIPYTKSRTSGIKIPTTYQ